MEQYLQESLDGFFNEEDELRLELDELDYFSFCIEEI